MVCGTIVFTRTRYVSMVNSAFGRALRDLRLGKGLSQERLAEQSGLHRTYISQLERGLKSPSLETIFAICKALSTSMSHLIRSVEALLN
jgi:transcriptional regulator with XRE-family HTH domain